MEEDLKLVMTLEARYFSIAQHEYHDIADGNDAGTIVLMTSRRPKLMD
jgi:hypothetical protein